ncbi:MAG: sulfurtransferase-like selenium metabolism protein YedF [Eubacteriales bacterium]|nr:sulfurtransferase-like selenium metabolism protein YedF [Eubacteriales bacterium]
MIQVNAMGDACPIPVVKTKKAISAMKTSDILVTLVDNEIAVQNLTKLGKSMGYPVTSEKLGEKEYKVQMEVTVETEDSKEEKAEEVLTCIPDSRNNTVVVISSPRMGEGNDELGTVLMKGFLYALTQLDELPKTILFYNGGATLTCEGSASLEDLKSLEAQGVEILTCGTCLNYYEMSDKLRVGEVTNMYTIAEKMTGAGKLVKP